jgi:hypothetical protein
MMRGVIESRIALLERRKSVGDRVVHFHQGRGSCRRGWKSGFA